MNTREILKTHNAWRRGDAMRTQCELGFSVTELGVAIDDAVRIIDERDQLRAELEKERERGRKMAARAGWDGEAVAWLIDDGFRRRVTEHEPDGSEARNATPLYASPAAPAAKVPDPPPGFVRLAYKRGPEEWLYLNHANTWQHYQGPVTQPQERAAPECPTHTTEPAESVMGIALRQLGDESRWVEIRDLNAVDHPDVGPHDYYPVGTVLRMPDAAPTPEKHTRSHLPEGVTRTRNAATGEIKPTPEGEK